MPFMDADCLIRYDDMYNYRLFRTSFNYETINPTDQEPKKTFVGLTSLMLLCSHVLNCSPILFAIVNNHL